MFACAEINSHVRAIATQAGKTMPPTARHARCQSLVLRPDKRPPADAEAVQEASAGDRLSRRGQDFGACNGSE